MALPLSPDRYEDGLGGGRRRRAAVAILATTMALGIVPMVGIGVLAPLLIDDLGIDRADVGVLVAVVAGVSALLSPAIGARVDRVGDRAGLLAVLALGTVSLALMAGAFSLVSMAIALAVAGVCRAGCNPATNRVIQLRVPPGHRGWTTGIKQSGEAVAIVVAASVLPGVAALAGWRAALLLLSALTAVTAVAALVVVRGSRREDADVVGDGRLRESIHWLNAHCLLMGCGAGAVTGYLPLYAHERGGLSVATAGTVMVVAGAVGGVFRVLWSRWSERRLGFPASLAALALIAALSGLILTLAGELKGPAFWLGAAVWGASGLAFGSVAMMAVIAEADDWNTGRASGLTVLWFGLGFTVLPPLFGLIAERSGYAPGFALITALYLIAAAIIALGRSTFRRPLTAGAE